MGLLDTIKEWHESGIDILGATPQNTKQVSGRKAAANQAADRHKSAANRLIAVSKKLSGKKPKGKHAAKVASIATGLSRLGQHHSKKADDFKKQVAAAASTQTTASATRPTGAKPTTSSAHPGVTSRAASPAFQKRTAVHGQVYPGSTPPSLFAPSQSSGGSASAGHHYATNDGVATVSMPDPSSLGTDAVDALTNLGNTVATMSDLLTQLQAMPGATAAPLAAPGTVPRSAGTGGIVSLKPSMQALFAPSPTPGGRGLVGLPPQEADDSSSSSGSQRGIAKFHGDDMLGIILGALADVLGSALTDVIAQGNAIIDKANTLIATAQSDPDHATTSTTSGIGKFRFSGDDVFGDGTSNVVSQAQTITDSANAWIQQAQQTLGLPPTAASTAWQPNTNYPTGAQVMSAGNSFQAATGGTSGTVAPSGTTGMIQDGTVTWVALTGTASQWMANTNYSAGQQVMNVGNNYQAISAGRSAASGGPTATSGIVQDGTVRWAYMGAGTAAAAGGPWMPNTYYPSGSSVVNPMGSSYQAAVGGTSGATPPMATSGMVQDGTVQWMYAGGQMPMDQGAGGGGGGSSGGGGDDGGGGAGGGEPGGDDGSAGPSDFGPSGGDQGGGGDDEGGSPLDPGLSAASSDQGDPFADDDGTSSDSDTAMAGDVSFEWYDVFNPAGGVIRNIDQNENKPSGGGMNAGIGTSRVTAQPAFTADQQGRIESSRQRLAQIQQQRSSAYSPAQVAAFVPPPPSSGFADRLSASKGFLAQAQGDAMQGDGENQEDPPEQGYTLREEIHNSAQEIVDAFDGVAPGPDAKLAPGGLVLHETEDISTSPWNIDITDTPADPLRRNASLHLGAGYLQTFSYPRGGASSGQEGGSMIPKETIRIYGEESGSTYDRGADVLGVMGAKTTKPVPRAQFTRATTPAGNKYVSMTVNTPKKGDNKKSVANARDAAKRAVSIGTKLKKAAKATHIKGAVAPARGAHPRATARHHLTAAQIAKAADAAIKAGTDASKHADKHEKLYTQNDHKKVLGVAAVKKVLAQSGATKVHGDDDIHELFHGVRVLGHSVTLLGEAAIADGLRTSPGFLDDILVLGDASYGLTSTTPIVQPGAAVSPYGVPAPSAYNPANPPDPNNPGYLSDGSVDPSATAGAPDTGGADPTAGPPDYGLGPAPTADSVKLQPGVDYTPDPHPDGNDQNQYSSLPQGAVVYLGDSPKGNVDFLGSWNHFFGGGDGYFFGKQGWIYFQGDDWSPKKTSGDFGGAVQQIYAESIGKAWGPLIGNPKKPNDADWANGLRFDKSSGSLFWFYDKAPAWATENDNQVRLNQAILDYKAKVAAAAADAAAQAAQDQLDTQNAAQLQKQQAADDAQMAHQQEQDQAQAESDSQIQAKADTAADRQQQSADESMARQAAAQAEIDVKSQESAAAQAREDALTQAQIDQQALETRARLGLPIEEGGGAEGGGGLDDGSDMGDTGGEPTDTGEADTELSGSARVRQHLQY